MLDTIRLALMPWYMEIKFVHLLFVMMWGMSTGVAYLFYVRFAFLRWQREPENPERIALRNWTMDQFDKGVIIEHIAFPVILVTGPTLYWLGGWSVMDARWLAIKLSIAFFIFVPIEIIDYWISHFGGRKSLHLLRGDDDKYEQAILWQWGFFRLTTPIVSLFIPAMIFLAVVKPSL